MSVLSLVSAIPIKQPNFKKKNENELRKKILNFFFFNMDLYDWWNLLKPFNLVGSLWK